MFGGMGGMGGGMGGMGGMSMLSSLGSMFGGFGGDSGPDFEAMMDLIKGYSDPFVMPGRHANSTLEELLQKTAKNPEQMYNQFGNNFQQSPGYDFAMKQALSGIGNAAAAGGMSGAPMHQQQAGDMASQLANQDFGNYMQRVMSLYGTGISGLGQQANLGWDASKTAMEDLVDIMGAQGAYGTQAGAGKQMGMNNMLGGMGSIGGSGGFGGMGGGSSGGGMANIFGGMGGGGGGSLGSSPLSFISSMFNKG